MDKVLLSQSPQILQKTMFLKSPERSWGVVWRESCHLSCTVEQARPTLFIPLDDLNFNRLQRQNPSFTAQTCLLMEGKKSQQANTQTCAVEELPALSREGTRAGITPVCTLLCEQEISAKLIYQTQEKGLVVLSVTSK